MVFELLDLKPRNPYLSLAMDEAIALHMARNHGMDFKGGIRLWSNPPAIVLGRTCRPEKNVMADYLKAFRVSYSRKEWEQSPSLCRRVSGGGTVLHGPGNINYSIFIPLEAYPSLHPLKGSYKIIMGMVQRAIGAQELNCEIRGISDLVLLDGRGNERKISGNAQFRKYGILMHHGTLITRSRLIESVAGILRHPPKEPEYRGGRDHTSFLGSLPDTFDITAFYNFLAAELRTLLGVESLQPLTGTDLRAILGLSRRLVRETYARRDWILEGRFYTDRPSIRDGFIPGRDEAHERGRRGILIDVPPR